MDIKLELSKLYNTLLTIPTNGEHTKTMADCLRFLEQLINYEEPKKAEKVNKEKANKEK